MFLETYYLKDKKKLTIKYKQYIEDKLARRLHMFLINFNSFIGVIFGVIIFIISIIFDDIKNYSNFDCYHIVFSIIILMCLSILFYYNAYNNRKSREILKRILMIINREDLAIKNYKDFKKKITKKLKNQHHYN
ncbi:MAG: hypothetical protein V1865_01230 [bacterium]